MNMDIDATSIYLDRINKEIKSKRVIICPTSIYIPYFLKHNYSVGLQNTYSEKLGAYTGEISPYQASQIGIKYVILGHSERRIYLNESDIFINKKIKEAINNNLNVIFCIGENIEEKNLFKTNKVLNRQIDHGLRDINDLSKIIIAYEPVWSIGSGNVPTNSEISSIVDYIKEYIKTKYKTDIKVLYGGSVNDSNIKSINKIKNIDGVLVGGAAPNADKLLKIIEVVVNQ